MRVFSYLADSEYDKKVKVRQQQIDCFSQDKLDEKYEDEGYINSGILRTKKGRNAIGTIHIGDTKYYVDRFRSRNRLFTRIVGYARVDKRKFIALIKIRVWAIILAAAILFGLCAFLAWNLFGFSPNSRKLKGHVSRGGSPLAAVELTLKEGDKTVGFARSGTSGGFTISNIPDGIYQIEYAYGDSVMTTLVEIDGPSNYIDLEMPESTVKARLVYRNETTAPIAVGGLDKYAASLAEEGKEVSVTLYAEQVRYNQSEAHRAIKMEAENQSLIYFSFSLMVEISQDGVLLSRETVKELPEGLTVAVRFDTAGKEGLTVYRCAADTAEAFLPAGAKSTGTDGTFAASGRYVRIYTAEFGTFAIGWAGSADSSSLGYDTHQGDETDPPVTEAGKPQITMPGFTTLKLKANQTVQTTGFNFFNPEKNAGWYDMTFELRIDRNGDGELVTYYTSGLVAPGNHIMKMELKKALPAGIYEGEVFIQPYLYGDTAYPLNNGILNVIITVN